MLRQLPVRNPGQPVMLSPDDSLDEGPREGVRRQVFVPTWDNNSATFYVRSRRDSDSLFADLRREVKRLDSAMPVFEMKPVGAA
jgi:hypothetical protein